MTILSFNISVYNFLSSQIFDSISQLGENSVARYFWNYFFVFNKIKKISPRMIIHYHKKPVAIYIHIIDCLLMNSKFWKKKCASLTHYLLKSDASSRWSSSLYCPMRISGEMTIGKTQPTLYEFIPWQCFDGLYSCICELLNICSVKSTNHICEFKSYREALHLLFPAGATLLLYFYQWTFQFSYILNVASDSNKILFHNHLKQKSIKDRPDYSNVGCLWAKLKPRQLVVILWHGSWIMIFGWVTCLFLALRLDHNWLDLFR